jgi:hypothetical protein
VAAARARWWATFDPTQPAPDALDGAAIQGSLPSPVGVTPPTRPWSPLHVEWSASYLPSPRGAHDWILGEVDYELPDAVDPPAPDPDHALQGRSILSSTPAALLDSAAGGGTTLAAEDLLSAPLADLDAQLRGDSLAAVVHARNASGDMGEGKRPDSFLAMRAGFLTLDRARVVDGFGQLLDLRGGAATAELRLGASLAVPGEPEMVALRPRFTAPAQALLRFADAGGQALEAGAGVSPVCGYVVASPLDGTLELFDADGAGYGRLRPDTALGTAWEEDPGRASAVGALPGSTLPNAFLGQMADGILAADTAAAAAGAPASSAALQALVRVLDTTAWSVDLTGRSGDEHLALLLGHPIAVVRAVMRIHVQDPRRPAENDSTAVRVKLGTLAHLQDGLLAYYVGDDFGRVHVIDPAVPALAAATGDGPIAAPYVDPRASFDVYPERAVPLTLLMVPGSDVHVTTGLLPQKKVGLMREWTAPALSRLSPSLRFGPVLRDGEATRLPVAPDVRGNWTWHRRSDPATWATDAVIPSTVSALLPDQPVRASDGWLQVQLLPDTAYPEYGIKLQITCVQTHRYRTGKQLVAVGGKNPDGSPFLLPVAQAIQLIEGNRFSFFVDEAGTGPVPVKVVRMRRGVKYLRTKADRRDPNNLLRLPSAPP